MQEKSTNAGVRQDYTARPYEEMRVLITMLGTEYVLTGEEARQLWDSLNECLLNDEDEEDDFDIRATSVLLSQL